MESILEIKREQQKIEDQILALITDGNVMGDEVLADTLTASKKTVDELTQRLAETVATEAEINRARVQYQMVAHRGMQLYFCLIDFAVVDHMYQFGLNWFLKLFVHSLGKSEPNAEADIHTRYLSGIQVFI